MKKCTMLFSFLFLLISMSFAQQRFEWLAGTWKMKDKPVYEEWKMENEGSMLSGFSYRVKGADTVVMEQIRLTFDGSTYHYIPDVAGEQGPVDFVITPKGAHGFVAENPAHDFPKVIRYALVRRGNVDFIEASIEGDGKVINYVYERLR